MTLASGTSLCQPVPLSGSHTLLAVDLGGVDLNNVRIAVELQEQKIHIFPGRGSLQQTLKVLLVNDPVHRLSAQLRGAPSHPWLN